jgi:hypothetical protein
VVGFCAWKGDGLETVAEVEEFFARVCFEADQVLGEPAACRWFLNWFDETPRDEMRRQLLPEVNRVLAQRLGQNVEIDPDREADTDNDNDTDSENKSENAAA